MKSPVCVFAASFLFLSSPPARAAIDYPYQCEAGDSMKVDGYFGIGTATLSYRLHVVGTTYSNKFSSPSTNVETVSGNYDPTKMVYNFNENRGWGYNSADNTLYAATSPTFRRLTRQ